MKQIKSVSIRTAKQLTKRIFLREKWERQGKVSLSGFNKTENKLLNAFPRNEWILVKVNEK